MKASVLSRHSEDKMDKDSIENFQKKSKKKKKVAKIDRINFRKTGTYDRAKDLSIPEFAQVLDYVLSSSRKPWIITGEVNPIYFSNDFTVVDIDGQQYQNLESYSRAMATLYDQDTTTAQIISCEQSDTDKITVTSRITGRKHVVMGSADDIVELKPHIQYTEYVISPQSGLIVSQSDRSSIPNWDIYFSSKLPILNGVLTAEIADEVQDRIVVKPEVMKRFYHIGKIRGEISAQKDDAVKVIKKSISDGVFTAKDFIVDLAKVSSSESIQASKEEEELAVGDSTNEPLSQMMTSFLDDLKWENSIVNENVMDLTKNLRNSVKSNTSGLSEEESTSLSNEDSSFEIELAEAESDYEALLKSTSALQSQETFSYESVSNKKNDDPFNVLSKSIHPVSDSVSSGVRRFIDNILLRQGEMKEGKSSDDSSSSSSNPKKRKKDGESKDSKGLSNNYISLNLDELNIDELWNSLSGIEKDHYTTNSKKKPPTEAEQHDLMQQIKKAISPILNSDKVH